jgi:hypothetical protein
VDRHSRIGPGRVIHQALAAALPGLVILASLATLPAHADGPLYTETERFGIGFARQVETSQGVYEPQSLSSYHVEQLRMGWYSDWSISADPGMPADVDLEYVQLFEVSQPDPDWAALQAAVVARPGSLWILGNEPECPNQGNMTPEVYAERYHTAREAILGWDPGARVAVGGVVEPTKLRFLWLERFLAAYRSTYGVATVPVDVWTIHIQILSEGSYLTNDLGERIAVDNRRAFAGIPTGINDATAMLHAREMSLADNANPDMLKAMVWDFRDWMHAQGYGDRELIISEMGVLYPSTYLVPAPEGMTPEELVRAGDRRLETHITESFTFLLSTKDGVVGCPTDEGRLVQRWLWYSLNDHLNTDEEPWGFNGSLYDPSTHQPTRFGDRVIAYRNRDLRPPRLRLPMIAK